MALRAVTTPLDPLTQAEWRATLDSWIGITYANLKATLQTEVDRIIDEMLFRLLQRHGHEPWGRRVWTVGGTDFTAPSTSTGLFELPGDLYHIIRLQESENGTGVVGLITNMEGWMDAGAGRTAHPWDGQSEPRYFFKAMSDDNPPVQTWQRVPTPSSTISAMTIVGRGYPTLLGTTGDTISAEVPAAYVPEMRHDARSEWAALRKEYDTATRERELRNEALAMTQINDAPDGAEVLIRPDMPGEFYDEMEI
jgi:hypothetical protein